MIRFLCPGCGAVYTVDDNKGGKTGKCPKCQSQFTIPVPEAAATPRTVPPPVPAPSPASTSEPVEIAPCPGCQARLSVAPSNLGIDVECPYCKTAYRAVKPGTDTSAPLPPPVPPLISRQERVGDRDRRDDDEERPSRRRRRRRDADELEERPSRRRRRDEDDEDIADYDDRPRRRRDRPGAITAIGGMLLGGGILGVASVLLAGVFLGLGSMGICCLWPGWYYELVVGILMIVRGAAILGQNDRDGPPKALAVMQITMIVNLDVVNCVLGIIELTMLNNPEARDYYWRHG